MNVKIICEYGAKLCEAQILMLEADGAKAENKQREFLGQSVAYGMDFFEELAEKVGEISEALKSLVSENKELDILEVMLKDQLAMFCGDCKQRLDNDKTKIFRLDPPISISNWDKENGWTREDCFFCCNKIRMRNEKGTLFSYNLPEGVKLVEEGE
jgi:hypothetical protein